MKSASKWKEDIITALSLDEFSNDPESEPYISKYKARKIYKEILEDLENQDSCTNNKIINVEENLDSRQCIESNESIENISENNLNVLAVRCFIYLRLGINFYDTEETSSGLELFEKILEISKFYRSQKELFGSVLQQTYNHLGMIWAERSELIHAEEYLRQAIALFEDFSEKGAPETLHSIFGLKVFTENDVNKKRDEFETNYTLTLFYLAQLLGKTKGRERESAHYCHSTLQRQLKRQQYDNIEWSLNAATLAQYYVVNHRWYVAHHCLCAASCMIENHSVSDESNVELLDKLLKARADVNRCWVKYVLNLLEQSYALLSEEKAQVCEEYVEENDSVPEKLLFDMELGCWEKAVVCVPVCTAEEARSLFLFLQEKLNVAKKYFTLQDCCSDYVELVQDHSSAYRLLASFELDLELQCRMHKRRVDLLKQVLAELNTQHYLLVCRQLLFELGETLNKMLDLKLTLLGHGKVTPAASRKINQLALDGLAQFKRFLDLYRQPNGAEPERYSEMDTRPALLAHFYRGRLFAKVFESERSRRLEHLSSSEKCYQAIIDYCERVPEAAQSVASELSLCHDMVQLMPLKMQQVMNDAC